MIVFVHGNPETGALWDGVRSHLDRPSMAVDLPGFGTPRPDGFGATKDEYVEWLVGELDRIGEPVDLVGHDWGAGLTYRVATAYGDRLSSWVADVANIAHPDYVWHDFAKIWQTPGEGEAFMEGMIAAGPEGLAAAYEGNGISHDDALRMAGWMDQTMASCVLDLYRSALPNPYADWGDRFAPTSAPGLVIHATDDPYSDETKAREVADLLGARVAVLEGLGHWWALQDPAAGARVLEEFWASR